ncbi:carboxypeptidase-like regulatory domain-containing protein [Candidatus Marinimicrobia bacterium]|nr:carboxypeptidase-like regulatory domain-containing protein [Candidatus Neomarinimicrobiota bacterium]MDC1145957.1 carboxypeptidase-like regulatory domain-containing protein [Candidatus Neomarinimicrobiota bacterium]
MKLNKSSFQYLFVFLLSVATLTAQTVSGTVSGADGSALAGANVTVEGTDMGASSNQDGSFSISGLSDGDYTLTASYIGYDAASAMVSVSGGQAANVNLTLESGNVRLNQVVVSASFKKELVTEAPASVEVFGGAELEARGATTIADVLSNRAGVETMKTGLEGSNVTVRGFNGVFSGAIHAVVDNRWTRAPVVNAQLLQFMAPDDSDIQRVELVRGPASPMYGPDTQQGVIAMFSKSPFNQGNRVAVTVGERDYMKVYARIAHQWGARAATRIAISHRSFNDWEANMPATQAEANAQGHNYWEPTMIRRGLATPVYPFISYGGENDPYKDPVTGSPNDAAFDFNPEATTVDMKTEFRPDLRSNLTLNFRMANVSAIEMTGVGRALADDATLYQAQLSYLRQGFLGGDLFLNLFTNWNDQKSTYNLSTGNIVYDESSNLAFQLQHNIELNNGQSLVWGGDMLQRTPDTQGTINGKNEDIDDFDNIGAYFSYEKKWDNGVKFVGTGRMDSNNYLSDIGTDFVFAPKVALVWSPEDVRGTFRLTYGENIDLPGNFTKNLDIAVLGTNLVYGANGLDFTSPALGGLPFQPDFQAKAMGSTTTGWTYNRDANGNHTYRTNWSPAWGANPALPAPYYGADVNTNYSLNDPVVNGAMWGIFAPVIGGGFLQGAQGQALLAGYGAAVGAGYAAATGDVAGAAAYGAGQAALAANDFLTLMGTAIPAIGNVVLDGDLNIVDPNVEFGNYDVIKETTWAQTEFGYKGQVTDNMTLAVDVYQMNISDYVSNLQQISGFTVMAADGGSYVAALLTGMYGNDNLTNFVNAMDSNGEFGGADELATAIAGGVAQLPTGSIAPEQSPYGANIVVGYKQLTEDLKLNGMEATLNYFPSNDWNFYMNMSTLSESTIDAEDQNGRISTVNMNTPKFKMGAGMQYAGEGVSYGMSLRYQDSYFADGFASTSGQIPSFYTLGVNGKWNVDSVPGMSVGLSIDNITDVVHKETFLGPEMGRFTTLSVGYDL